MKEGLVRRSSWEESLLQPRFFLIIVYNVGSVGRRRLRLRPRTNILYTIMENLLVEGVDSPLTRFSFPFLFLAGTAKKHGKGKVILLLGGNLLLRARETKQTLPKLLFTRNVCNPDFMLT